MDVSLQAANKDLFPRCPAIVPFITIPLIKSSVLILFSIEARGEFKNFVNGSV